MPKFRSSQSVFLLILFTLLFTSAASAAQKSGDSFTIATPDWQLTSGDPWTVTNFVYSNASLLSQTSDQPVTFEITDLRTISLKEFNSVAWLDLFSLPGSQVLELNAMRPGKAESIARLQPQWREVQSGRDASEFQAKLGRTTAQTILGKLIAQDTDWSQVDAISTFSVNVTAGGKTSQHRAAFFWLNSTKDGYRTFWIEDHLVQGLESALARNLFPERPDSPGRTIAPLVGGGSCLATPAVPWLNETQASLAGLEQHNTGQHNVQMRLGGTCQTSGGCISICGNAYLAEASCNEAGTVKFPYTHRVYKDAQTSNDSQLNNIATCRGAVACAVESCGFGGCKGITVNLTVGVAGFTASTSGAAPLWKWTVNDSRACPAAIPVPVRRTGGGIIPQNQYNPPGDGSGGGGTSGSVPRGTCDFVCIDDDYGSTCWLTCR